MPLGNYAEPEVAVAAAVTAAAASPSVRQIFRKSFIYGLAGVLVAYDKAAVVAKGVVQGVALGAAAVAANTKQAAEPPADSTPPPSSPST